MSLRAVVEAFVTAAWGSAALVSLAFACNGRVTAAGATGAVCVGGGIVTAVLGRRVTR